MFPLGFKSFLWGLVFGVLNIIPTCLGPPCRAVALFHLNHALNQRGGLHVPCISHAVIPSCQWLDASLTLTPIPKSICCSFPLRSV